MTGPTWPTGGRSPREEAERLVAAALAAASVAARSTAGFATGSAECCVCPVCKALAAMRDPTPEFAERLASGVGDLAAGLTSVLKAFGTAERPAASYPTPPEQRHADFEGAEDDVTVDPWQAATRAPYPPQTSPGAAAGQPPTPAPKPVAKKAVRQTVRHPGADDGAEVGASGA